jgi:transposase
LVVPESPVSSPATLSSTRMEIVVSRDRRIIVDAGVDVAALARVLDLLSRR